MTAAATLQSVAQPRSGRMVLVVDDEPTIAEVVARYLERAGSARAPR
jgi:CheY-like chemotaxis protein